MAEPLFGFTAEDVSRLHTLLREFESGALHPRPRHRAPRLPWRYPSEGGQCYIGLAISEINGYTNADGFSSGSFRFAAWNDEDEPSSLTYESLSDTTKRVTAWNISENKMGANQAALIWKQPNGTYFAYPWFYQNHRIEIRSNETFSAGVCDVFTQANAVGSLTTLTSVSGNQKVVFDRAFHCTGMGTIQFTVAADSGSGTLSGEGGLTISWVNLAGSNLDTTYYFPVVQAKSGGGDRRHNYQFNYWARINEGGYINNVVLTCTGDVTLADISGIYFETTLISNLGWNTPTEFSN